MSKSTTTGNGAARSQWSNRFVFILAAAGCAIGLGNLWKFPYITGVNGGGAFVLIYLFCILLVGVPVFIAELYIGKTTQKNTVEAFETLDKKHSFWKSIGWLGVACAFLILSFYSVVGGWVLDFSFLSLANRFAAETDDQIKGTLGEIFNAPARQLFFHFLFMFFTTAVVASGVEKGIERWNKILMPALFILLFFLLIQAVSLEGFGKAVNFLFSFDTSKLTPAGVLEAAGHSFFTLSLGMGAMITYGSYLDKKQNVTAVALSVAFLDTLIALLAGIVIFSVVFTFGMEAGSGPTLMFQTLPMLFSKMTGGYFVSVAFFLLVSFAALTSAMGLMEVAVAFTLEKFGISRFRAAIINGVAIYLLGILTALSTNKLADFKILGLTFFDLFDKLTSSILMPLGGCLTAIFFGWFLGPKVIRSALGEHSNEFFAQGVIWSSRIVAPVAIIYIMLHALGLV